MDRPLALLAAAVVCSFAPAQDFPLSNLPDNLAGNRMASPPTIDGAIGEAEWAEASTSRRSLVVIATNSASGDKGQYWFGYDGKYIYIAARIALANGAKVKADEYRENVSLGGDDQVTLILDLFGTSQDFNFFTFNAAGATQIQVAGGRAAKREWGGAFESRGRVTETGWEAEARIEWAIIPLPPTGPRNIKVLFDWYVSSTQRGVSTHSTQGDLTKMHVLTGVEVPDIPVRRTFDLLPYAYVGYDDETKRHIANAGLDLKTEVTEDLNFVMTINPDFRNIENEILNLDFSNFERLPGESRPFFLEGSQFLLTGNINQRRLFASQRIGGFDTGVNFYGSLNGNSQIGALGIINFDQEHAMVTAGSFSPDPNNSFYGAFTALDREGEDNFAGSLEYFTRRGDYLLFTGYQLSDDEVTGQGDGLAFGYQYRARGLTNTLIYEQVSPDFNPRIGFAPQRGYRGASTNFQYTKSHPRGDVMETNFNVGYVNQDMYSGGHYREVGNVHASATFRNALNVLFATSQDQFLTMYNTFYTLALTMPRNDTFRGWSLVHTRGDVAGDTYNSTTARVFYRPIKRLQLELRYQTVQHTVDTDQTVFTMNWEMDAFQSVGGRLVGQGDEWNWFLSYKRSGNLGAEYFLILGDPNATSFQKTLVFKVSVPFTVG
ncbi:MAG: DUF5916 domain-containing protein [Fimbriimonadaceae bacterium]